MSHLKQLASRLNAAKSTGPKTPEGKRNSSRNALKHGLASDSLFVLRNEVPERWQALLDLCRRHFEPRNAFESELVTEIAAARWRLSRLWSTETALLDRQMDLQRDQLAENGQNVDESARLASAFKSLSDESRSLANLTRHESRIRRNYERALAELAAFRAGQLPARRLDRQLAPLVPAHPAAPAGSAAEPEAAAAAQLPPAQPPSGTARPAPRAIPPANFQNEADIFLKTNDTPGQTKPCVPP